MNKTAIFALSVIFALTSTSFTNIATAAGHIYYVAKTGSDSNSCSRAQSQSTPKLTINAGISCLASGDTLYIMSGTYREELSFPSIPSGNSWGTATTIAAFPENTVTIKPDGGYHVMILSNVSYIIFDHIIFDGSNQVGDGVKLTSHYDGSGRARTGTAANHMRFTDVEVYNPFANCFGVGGDYNEFIRVKAHSCGIRDTAYGPGHNSFYIASSHNLIEYSTVYDGQYGIAAWSADRSMDVPSYNIFRYNIVYNMSFPHAGGAVNGGAGINLLVGDGNVAHHNIVYGSRGEQASGIVSAYGATNTLIYNNTVYEITGGYYSYCVLVNDATDTIVKNNICYKNSSGSIADRGTRTIQSNNITSLDPLFVDAANGNFSLQAGSPAIGAGIPYISNAIMIVNSSSSVNLDAGAIPYVP